MKYSEIRIKTNEPGIEALCAKLLSVGIENTAVTDPQDIEEIMEHKQSYKWDYIEDEVAQRMKLPPEVTVYTEDDEETERVLRAVEELKADADSGVFGPGADFGTLEVTVSQHDDSEWKDKWKEYFKPFRVSEHILIKPTWEQLTDAGSQDIVIEIDPGMAFGTGTHETTSMCIEMLDAWIRPGMRVLDAGCGSGILSIAAAKLGAADVLGVDIDETAVEVAKENIALNHMEQAARAEYGDVTEGVDYKADLCVANLMAELLCMITPDVPAHLTPGGLYISSGILVEKEQLVLDALKSSGFRIQEVREKGEWCCIAASLGEPR